jgi:dihydroorotase
MGGTVLDPSQGIYEKKDIAVSDGKVEEIGNRISAGNKVIDATGLIVTPGFVDIHAHVARDVLRLSIDPEEYCLTRGTTTVVDAGSSGELNFIPFRDFVISKSNIRILAFLNIESLGMIEFIDSPLGNTDQEWAQLLNSPQAPMFVNPKNTKKMIRENRQVILGIKWAHHGLDLLELARKTADELRCKVMGESRYLPDSLEYLKKGDIATHIFHYAFHRITKRHDGITEDCKTIHPEVFAAAKRGVVLDVGHGKGSFSWDVARLALNEGLEPDTISTDLWVGNVNGPVYDLPTTMAKFLHLGMSLGRVVETVTSKPASVLGRTEFGTLKPGTDADIVAFKLQHKTKVLVDCYGKSEKAGEIILPVHVVRGGSIVR